MMDIFTELELLGISHRDLKPENILLSLNNQNMNSIKKYALCDFSEGK